uniref:Uncharacterized protein n=2 Tax=Musa acuminata subsp. malaccensis TaxID=214687 RepID=A0A804JLK9_MUSAM
MALDISEQSFGKSYWENLEHYKDMELQSLKWQTSMIDRFSEQNSNGCCTRESLLLSTQHQFEAPAPKATSWHVQVL